MPAREHQRRARWVRLTVAAGMVATVAIVVAVIPGAALFHRDLAADDPQLQAVSEQHVQMTAGEELASTVVARSRDTGWGHAIRVHVERPDPTLQDLSVRLSTGAAGIDPHRVLLATPSGDWPAIEYGSTPDGDLRFSTRNMGWDSTSVLEFHIPEQGAAGERPGELLVEIRLQQATAPSWSAWRGSTRFPLALGR